MSQFNLSHGRFLALAILLLALAACTPVKELIKSPTIKITGASLTNYNLDQAEINFALNIKNPNPFAIKTNGLDYALKINGARAFNGALNKKLNLPANGTSSLQLPVSALVTVADNDVTHLEGGHKGIKKALPKAIINKLPLHLQNYKLALWDKDKKNIILVMDTQVGDKQGRAAVKINFKLNRGNVTNSVRSLGIINLRSLKRSGYEVIEGEW